MRLPPGDCGSTTLQRAALARRLDQRGIGLLVVPLIGVAAPVAAVVVQHLRFDPPPAGRIALHQLQRERLHQHRVQRKIHRPAEHRAGHHRRPWRAPESIPFPARPGTARPWRGRIHCSALIENGSTPSATRCSATDGEQARLAQLAGKRVLRRAARRCEPARGSCRRRSRADTARPALSSAKSTIRTVGSTSSRYGSPSSSPSDLHAPDAARLPIAEDVRAVQLRELLAAIDEAAGDRRPFGVRNLDRRRHDRRGPALPLDVHRLPTFDQAPAEVVALVHADTPAPTAPSPRRRPTGRPCCGRSSSSTGCAGRRPRSRRGSSPATRTDCRRESHTAGSSCRGWTSMRRIDDSRSEQSWPVLCSSGGKAVLPSPVEIYRQPSGPNFKQPPLWPPCSQVMISVLAGDLAHAADRSRSRAAARRGSLPDPGCGPPCGA